MIKALDRVVKFSVISGVIIFILVILLEVIKNATEDYKYALIGFLGSVIGGSLTLIGVAWTLRIQSRTKFIDNFPLKIRNLGMLKESIEKLIENNMIFQSTIASNQRIAYKQLIDSLKEKTIDIDGTSYFIVSKLENLFDEYYPKINEVSIYSRAIEDEFGNPTLTQDSIEKINALKAECNEIIDGILTELKEHERQLVSNYFRYKTDN